MFDLLQSYKVSSGALLFSGNWMEQWVSHYPCKFTQSILQSLIWGFKPWLGHFKRNRYTYRICSSFSKGDYFKKQEVVLLVSKTIAKKTRKKQQSRSLVKGRICSLVERQNTSKVGLSLLAHNNHLYNWKSSTLLFSVLLQTLGCTELIVHVLKWNFSSHIFTTLPTTAETVQKINYEFHCTTTYHITCMAADTVRIVWLNMILLRQFPVITTCFYGNRKKTLQNVEN